MEPRVRQDVSQFRKLPAVCKDGPYRGYSRLDWIHSAATRRKEARCGALIHHINVTNLAQAFKQVKGNRACGIDRVTKRSYQLKLGQNIDALAKAIQGGGWAPRPSREVLIPKPHGGTRPLAIGCLEDKIVQTLVARILEAIYEPLFHRHSYGFRRGKSAHQAVGRLYSVIDARRKNCVVVEMDIEKFFNSVDHEWLMRKLDIKIGDEHLKRLIRRMLRSSILSTDGKLHENRIGTPQGSPVSPVLANICLHYLLDDWFSQNWQSRGEIVRYADDAVFVFTNEQDAYEFQAQLKERMQQAGLKLNDDKSGIVQFSESKPQGTIPFLGFELYWGRDGKQARVLKMKTQPKRLHSSIKNFYDWIKAARSNQTTKDLLAAANARLRGHYGYFAVRFNQQKLRHFFLACTNALFKWLNRRSQRKALAWQMFQRKILTMLIPPPGAYKLIDLRSEMGSERKHTLKSRMRKIRTSGSVRSESQKRLSFT